MMLTLVSVARCRMEGNGVLGGQSPTAIRWTICFMICWYMGRLSRWENTKAISIYTVYTLRWNNAMPSGKKPGTGGWGEDAGTSISMTYGHAKGGAAL